MNILAIDTSSDLEFITLRSGKGLSSRCEHVTLSHSVTLIRSMDTLLSEQGITINDIDIFCAGTGPGSFTGIRITVSTMRMLSQITGKPLVGIPTPLLYAVSLTRFGKTGDHIMVALDARRERIFGAIYRIAGPGQEPVEIVPPGDHPIDELVDGADYTSIIAAGSGVNRFREKIERPGRNVLVPGQWFDGASVCDLAEHRWRENPSLYSDPFRTVPLYLRKSDAETAREK